MRRAAVWLLLAPLAACGGDDDGDLEGPEIDEATSLSIFESANGEIHAMHLAAFELPEWPAEADRDCPDGGTVHMITDWDGDEIRLLYHSFSDCEVDGFSIDGTLDYGEISMCEDQSYSLSMSGSLSVEDHGSCRIDADETCGAISGTTCGHPL